MKKLLIIGIICLFSISLFAESTIEEKTKKVSKLSTPGGKVVKTALEKLKAKIIIKGGCWDWVNYVFNEAGYSERNRKKVYWAKQKGPYADVSLLKSGDWIMFKNLSYGNVGHSGIFIYWIDYKQKEAMVLSYRGENSETPGRYKAYDIRYLFGIVRGKEAKDIKKLIKKKSSKKKKNKSHLILY